jgi:hypothetical protein
MKPTMSGTTANPACQPRTCPSCGGVECFERPRFFCGQLLNDKDLDSALQYVIDKNKLHNRYLVGNGVACGLGVFCDPCDSMSVTIDAGYAIDCCGNDIVLCQSTLFNVISYINTCFPPQQPGCNDKIRQPPSGCDSQPKEYCLILSYAETPVKPVTVLNRSSGCSSSACEPSRIDETYRLDLIDSASIPAPPPSFWNVLGNCLLPAARQAVAFAQQIGQLSDQGNTNYYAVFCQMKKYIVGLYASGSVRCNILSELNQMDQNFPVSGNQGQISLPDVYLALYSMWALILQYLIDCFCNALLVPCSDCSPPEGVILACITVQGSCITKICNRSRKQLLTGPALRYYFQPVITGVHKLLELLCCELDIENDLTRLFNPREIRFEGVNASASRVGNLAAFAVNTAKAPFTGLGGALFNLTNPNAITALDLVTRPLSEVQQKLGGNFKTIVKPPVSTAEAYSFANIPKMSMVIPPGSTLELTIDSNQIVTAFEVV